MAHSLGNDVLMHVLDLCGQNGISVEHVFMWEPAIPDDSFDTSPRKYMPMNLGTSSQALPYEYNYPNAQAGSKAMTVLYSDNDNILGAMPGENGTVDSKLAWNAQMMHDFYYGIMIPDHSIGTRVGLSIANLLSTSPVGGPLVYALLQKMGISSIDSGVSDSARIQLLQSKMADPAAGIHLASVAEALFMLDQYGMPHIDQHKKLFSIYHIANLFVYPLSYFFQDGACEQFYTQWKGFYSSFKAPVNGTAQDLPFYPTLAAQQQFMRQNLKDAFNFLSLGMYFAKQALTQGLSWSDTAKLIKDMAFSNQSMSDWLNNNAPYFEDETSNNIATLLLTGILTDGAMPEAAMGYSGVKRNSSFAQNPKYYRNNQKDPTTGKELLADHSAMMIPTSALMDEIYKRQLMQAAGVSFEHFGKYKEG